MPSKYCFLRGTFLAGGGRCTGNRVCMPPLLRCLAVAGLLVNIEAYNIRQAFLLRCTLASTPTKALRLRLWIQGKAERRDNHSKVHRE